MWTPTPRSPDASPRRSPRQSPRSPLNRPATFDVGRMPSKVEGFGVRSATTLSPRRPPPDEWAGLTPRGEWRSVDTQAEEAIQVLVRVTQQHEAAMDDAILFGPKQYQPETDSDEEDEDLRTKQSSWEPGDALSPYSSRRGSKVETLDDEAGVVAVLLSEVPMQDALVTLSRRSSAVETPSRAAVEEEAEAEPEPPMTEKEELTALAAENRQLHEAIEAALRAEAQHQESSSEKAAFRRMEKVYAMADAAAPAPEPEPEPEPEQPAVAGGDANLGSSKGGDLKLEPEVVKSEFDEEVHGEAHEGSPTPYLLFMLKQRDEQLKQQEQELQALRQQILGGATSAPQPAAADAAVAKAQHDALVDKAAHAPGAPHPPAAATAEAAKPKARPPPIRKPAAAAAQPEPAAYRANVTGMSSSFQQGAAPGGSLSELQENGGTFTAAAVADLAAAAKAAAAPKKVDKPPPERDGVFQGSREAGKVAKPRTVTVDQSWQEAAAVPAADPHKTFGNAAVAFLGAGSGRPAPAAAPAAAPAPARSSTPPRAPAPAPEPARSSTPPRKS